MVDTTGKILREPTITAPEGNLPAHLIQKFAEEASGDDTPPLMEWDQSEVHTAPPWSTIEVSEPGVRLKFGPMEFTAAKALELFTNAGIVAENPLPPMEEELFGYKRGVSEQLLPIGELGTKAPLPVLAGIGTIQALPKIKDPVIHRIFNDEYRAGPRLLGCVAAGPGIPKTAPISIAEFPPSTILARVQEHYYQLKTPYVIAVYHVQYGNLHLRCRPTPITADDTQLYAFPFPHIDGFGSVCLGPIEAEKLSKLEPLAAAVGAMTTYWHNGFQYYLGGMTMGGLLPAATQNPPANVHGQTHILDKDFSEWEKLSYEQVLAIPYLETEKLDYYVKHVTGRRGATQDARYPIRWFIEEQAAQAADYAAVQQEQE